jgi:hypothetical protein
MEEQAVKKEITDEFLRAGQSTRGGWSYKQLRLLGLRVGRGGKPLRSGWKQCLIGTFISIVKANEFTALKDAHLKSRRHPHLSVSADPDGWRTSEDATRILEKNQRRWNQEDAELPLLDSLELQHMNEIGTVR